MWKPVAQPGCLPTTTGTINDVLNELADENPPVARKGGGRGGGATFENGRAGGGDDVAIDGVISRGDDRDRDLVGNGETPSS